MGVDDWVEQNGQVFYDNRVVNQDDATALYGSGANYLANGTTYTAINGASIELGDYGFFKSNGKIYSSPDRAQNSDANLNADKALADAQMQVKQTHGNNQFAMAGAAAVTADGVTPDPSDIIPQKWIIFAALAGTTAYYMSKMQSEIQGILQRAGGPQGYQYALKATITASYICFTCPGGTKNLAVGDVWKYGETTQGIDRYPQSYLNSNNVQMYPEFTGNQVQIKIMEKTKIYS
jgi:hypothetical protein